MAHSRSARRKGSEHHKGHGAVKPAAVGWRLTARGRCLGSLLDVVSEYRGAAYKQLDEDVVTMNVLLACLHDLEHAWTHDSPAPLAN
jgi:hypothetical protein